MSDPDVEVVVIGGGAVGCACALELSGRGLSVMLLERLGRLGEGASTRNSGVIHSGVYYRPGSRKARTCLEGNERLYAWCAENEVPHRRCGKLIAAVRPADMADVERMFEQGRSNGVQGLQIVDGARVRAIEPEAAAIGALWVPSAGILDPAQLVKSLARRAAAAGSEILTDAAVTRVEPAGSLLRIDSARGRILCRFAVNAGGAFADRVAAMAGNAGYRIHPCRGEYCEVVPDRCDLVRGLLYPAGHHGPGLGVHFTRTVAGGLLVGPNARYVEEPEEYETGRTAIEPFWESARALVPSLRVTDLRLSYAGVRAKLAPAGDTAFRDFIVERDSAMPNLIHMMGIESPGLTASMALARETADFLCPES